MNFAKAWAFIKENWELISAILVVATPVIAMIPRYVRALNKSRIELLLTGEDEMLKHGVASFVSMTIIIGLSHVIAANLNLFSGLNEDANILILLGICCIALLWTIINAVVAWFYGRTIKAKTSDSIHQDIEKINNTLLPLKNKLTWLFGKIRDTTSRIWPKISGGAKHIAELSVKIPLLGYLVKAIGFLVKWVAIAISSIVKILILSIKVIFKYLIGYDNTSDAGYDKLLLKREKATRRSYDAIFLLYMILFMAITFYLFSSKNDVVNKLWMRVLIIIALSIIEAILSKLVLHENERGKFGIKLELKNKSTVYVYSRINKELLFCGDKINQHNAKCRLLKADALLDENSWLSMESKDIPDDLETINTAINSEENEQVMTDAATLIEHENEQDA